MIPPLSEEHLDLTQGRAQAFRRLAELDAEDPNLAWAWAVYEQECLWLNHDAEALNEATKGWTDAVIKRALRTYGLLRGTGGALFAGDKNETNRAELVRLAKYFADQLRPGDGTGNVAIWKGFGAELAISLAPDNTSEWFLPSATSKFMWFHEPSIVPMYDRYAAAAAKDGHMLQSHDIKPDYFGRCYYLTRQNQNAITRAKETIGSSYPYDIRVLDKWLWLRGSGQQQAVLDRFKRGCSGLAQS